MYPICDHEIQATRSQARILHSVTVVDAGWYVYFQDLRARWCAHADGFSSGLCHVLQSDPQAHAGLLLSRLMALLESGTKHIKYGLEIKRSLGL